MRVSFMDCKVDCCWVWEKLNPELIRLLTALSATLENSEDSESEATDDFRVEMIWFFYVTMAAEVKDDRWLRS